MTRCPRLDELPPPPPGRRGWPWTEETPPLAPGSGLPRISLVTATYNRAPLLEETIRSILLQGYPDLEYYVLDADSRDGTVEILERYDPWLAGWVSEPDRGQSDALNKGLARCTGEIITYISSDDFYLPGTLADVAAHWPQLAERYGAVIGGFHHVDERSQRCGSGAWIPPKLPHEGPLDLSLVESGAWRLHQEATFYARHALDAIGRHVREDLDFNADRDLLIRLLRGYPVRLAQRCYSAFRLHEGSGTGHDAGRYPAQLEYARLFASFAAVRDGNQRRRRRVARQYHAKALVSLAKYGDRRPASIAALFRALYYQPSLISQRGYAKTWLKVTGLLSPLRRLKSNL